MPPKIWVALPRSSTIGLSAKSPISRDTPAMAPMPISRVTAKRAEAFRPTSRRPSPAENCDRPLAEAPAASMV